MVVQQESRSLLRSGFTLIELMVAIAILALIVGGGVPFALNQLKKAKYGTTKTDLNAIKASINLYHIAMGKYPQTLKDLIKPPREEQEKKRWKQGGGPFFGEEGTEEINVDPWNNPYKYKLTPGTKYPYELYSYGENGPGSPKEEWVSAWDK